MRYDNWDVLLFPTGRESKTPFKEFRVRCNVVPDVELSPCHEAVGMPIMTCFVPSLEAGAQFQLSVHSWVSPEVSQFTKSYSNHLELVQFEARIFIDGQLVATTVFDRKEEWPHLINSTCEVTKSGELAPLRFPSFQKELLNMSHWNPGDDLGRIKVVVSEGFPRASVMVPTERVKNIVAFSFQYAPLGILESIGVAWPNPSMWRLPSMLSSQLPVRTYHTDDGSQAHAHAHSPRARSFVGRPNALFPTPNMVLGAPQGQCTPFFGSSRYPTSLSTAARFQAGFGFSDPFDNMAYLDWMNPLASSYANDTSGLTPWPAIRDPATTSMSDETASSSDMMPEFSCQAGKRQAFGEPEPMHISGPSLEDEPLTAFDLQTAMPTNTMNPGSTMMSQSDPIQAQGSTPALPLRALPSTNPCMPPNCAHSLAHSLLNQPLPLPPQNMLLPASEVKSCKENRLLTRHTSIPGSASSTPVADHVDLRRFSYPLINAATGSNFNSTIPQEVSPCSASPLSTGTVFSSQIGISRAASRGDFGAALGSLRTGNTPMPLRNTSTGTLNSAGLGSGGRKRNREFTPASSKALDDEDQPLRPSPHIRATATTGYGLANDEND